MTHCGLCYFLKKYPEGFSLIKSCKISVDGSKRGSDLDFVHSEDFASYWEVPNVDQDYSKAFQLVSDVFQNTVSNDYGRRSNLDLSKFGFNVETCKIPVLLVEASGHIEEWDSIICNLMVFLPLSDHVEVYIKACPGFLGSVRMVFEQYLSRFVKLSIYKVGLSLEEQELISQMTSLQCLEITDVHPPEHLILHLDRLHELKELTLNCAKDEWDVINILPDGFKNLKNIKRIQLENVNLSYHSLRLIDFIGHFENLSSFTLSCNYFPEFEKLMKVVSENKKIQQIHLSGMFISKKEFEDLCKLLNYFFTLFRVQALPFLTKLEELKLPSGPEVKTAAASIIKQFRHLPQLRKIFLNSDILDDSSLIALAEEARGGNLSNLEKLELSLNHDITQSGWKDFFLMVDGLGHLNELCISRLYTHQFKTDPLTLIALVQCVSRLHHLNKLIMHGWLLDEKDLEMFNAMKKKHPQSKSFMLLWQWILPFQPNVTE
uniref:Uncharacterized protein n=1 Tax=Leptobrachium leishanense TaxID=445787 RepID=A0A8C5LKK9_9ANUR